MTTGKPATINKDEPRRRKAITRLANVTQHYEIRPDSLVPGAIVFVIQTFRNRLPTSTPTRTAPAPHSADGCAAAIPPSWNFGTADPHKTEHKEKAAT